MKQCEQRVAMLPPSCRWNLCTCILAARDLHMPGKVALALSFQSWLEVEVRSRKQFDVGNNTSLYLEENDRIY